MAITVPYLPYERLREIADKFLADYHPDGEIPIPIEQITEYKFEIDIVAMAGLQDSFDIESFITSDLTAIYIDERVYTKSLNRYRFSLAHELAHVVLHKDIFSTSSITSIDEWKAFLATIPAYEYGLLEQQAYSLAGLILVPPAPLAEAFEDARKKAAGAGVNLSRINVQARTIVANTIGRHFEVSGQVIARRLEYDELWN